jgi:hypothetical protein
MLEYCVRILFTRQVFLICCRVSLPVNLMWEFCVTLYEVYSICGQSDAIFHYSFFLAYVTITEVS